MLILVFVVLGVVLNAIVTWGCWKWARVWTFDGVAWAVTSQSIPAHFVKVRRSTGMTAALGMPLIQQDMVDVALPDYSLLQDHDSLPRSSTRTLLRKLTAAEAGFTTWSSRDDEPASFVRFVAWGWPLHSVAGSDASPPGAQFMHEFAFQLDRKDQGSFHEKLALCYELHEWPPTTLDGVRPSILIVHATVLNSLFFGGLAAFAYFWFYGLRRFFGMMRRRIRFLGFTAILAIMSSILVCWITAATVGRDFDIFESRRPSGGVWDGFPNRAPNHQFIILSERLVGRSQYLSSWRLPGSGGGGSGWPQDPPEAALPWWWGEFLLPVPLDQVRPQPAYPSSYTRYGEAWGIPFLAMWAGRKEDGSTRNPDTMEILRGIRLANIQTESLLGTAERVLPLGIIWPGFILNTVFYWWLWLTLFMLAWGGLSIRPALRRRRGLCASCGYDLRASDAARCPECGKSAGSSTD